MKKVSLILIAGVGVMSAATYDYDVLLKRMLENNHKHNMQKISVLLAKEEQKIADSQSYGKLTIEESIHRTNHAGMAFSDKLNGRSVETADFDPTRLNNPSATNYFDTSLTYEIPVFTGYKISSLESASKYKVDSQSALLKLSEKNSALELLKAYNGVIVASEYVKATEKAKKSAELVEKNTKAMFKQKIASKLDTTQASLHLSKMDAANSESRLALNSAIEYIKFLTGIDDINSVHGFKEVKLDEKLLKSYDMELISKRDDMKSAQSNLVSADYIVKAEKSSFLPQISGYAKYGFADDKITSNLNKDYYVVGASLSWMLFDGGETNSKLAIAKLNKKKASLAQEEVRAFAKYEIKKTTHEIEAKKLDLEEKITAAKLAEEIRLKYELMSKNGIIPLSDFLEKESDALFAIAAQLDAKMSYENSKAKAKIAIGMNIDEE